MKEKKTIIQHTLADTMQVHINIFKCILIQMKVRHSNQIPVVFVAEGFIDKSEILIQES